MEKEFEARQTAHQESIIRELPKKFREFVEEWILLHSSEEKEKES